MDAAHIERMNYLKSKGNLSTAEASELAQLEAYKAQTEGRAPVAESTEASNEVSEGGVETAEQVAETEVIDEAKKGKK